MVFGFAVLVLLGTILLALPVATESGAGAPLMTALFTSTSAVCVTGLVVVDTPTYWSTFGETTILVLIQLGGLGFLTAASLLASTLSRRLGLRNRIALQTETKATTLGDLRRLLLGVAAVTVVVEAVATVVLTARFATATDESLGRSLYLGVFHAISAFNNAGFGLYSDNMVGFVDDAVVCVTLSVAVIIGGIGFPVLLDLLRWDRQPQRWSLHTKLTVSTTAVLLVLGPVLVTVFEWSNPGTLGPLDPGGRLLAGWFQGVMPRTAGFNSIDYAEVREQTLLVTDVLMFVGGGSAGTAGGIKVATLAVVALAVWTEVRGDEHVHVYGRRVTGPAQRQALAVTVLGVGLVTAGAFALLITSRFGLDAVAFEAFSAFGTVGLSTGITGRLPESSQGWLIVLMFFGRLGPITVGTALALRERQRRYELPQERPIVG